MIARATFGEGKAEVYLADTLNKLDKSSAKCTAKCMAMISSSRAFCAKMSYAVRSKHLTAKDVAGIMRLYRTEQARSFKALNSVLDAELKAWEHELTDQGYIDMELEHLALKLAMNIASSCAKELLERLQRVRLDEIKSEREVRRLRSGCNVDTHKLNLPIKDEIKLLKELYLAGRHVTINSVD